MVYLKLRQSFYYCVGRPGRLYGRFDGHKRHAWALCNRHFGEIRDILIAADESYNDSISSVPCDSEKCRLCNA